MKTGNKGYGIYKTPLEEKKRRFLSRVLITDSCWYWRHTFYPNGYGRFYADSADYYAHIISYELFNGPVKKGMSVLHTCFNKACVNPEHLYLGTQLENANDADCIEHREKRLVLDQDKIDYILKAKDELPRSIIAKSIGVSLSTVDRVIWGKYGINSNSSHKRGSY